MTDYSQTPISPHEVVDFNVRFRHDSLAYYTASPEQEVDKLEVGCVYWLGEHGNRVRVLPEGIGAVLDAELKVMYHVWLTKFFPALPNIQVTKTEHAAFLYDIGTVLIHVKTGNRYRVVDTPNRNMLEATGEHAYRYTRADIPEDMKYNRCQREFEESTRFKLLRMNLIG